MDAVKTRASFNALTWPAASDVPAIVSDLRRLTRLGHERAEPAALSTAFLTAARVCYAFLLRTEGCPGPEVASLAKAFDFEFVAAALREHNSVSPIFAVNGLELLSVLTTRSPERIGQAGAAGVPEAVISLICAAGAHPNDATVASAGLAVLSHMSGANREGDLRVLGAGGVSAAAAVMRACPNVELVHEHACALLSVLADGPAENEASPRLEASGGVGLAVAAMQRWPGNEALARSGMLILNQAVAAGRVRIFWAPNCAVSSQRFAELCTGVPGLTFCALLATAGGAPG